MDAADQFLHLLKANPTLLPLAPAIDHGAAIERRRNDEVHPCLRCGQRAHCAFVAHFEVPAGPPEHRWLDLCHPCTHWLQANTSER
jgi:hypothetical protein